MKKLNKNIIIIGNGTAGVSAAKEILERMENCSIIIFSGEKVPFYFRPSIAYYISGKLSYNELFAPTKELCKTSGLKIIQRKILNIDPDNKKVMDSKGKKYNYDSLLISTGSLPHKINKDSSLNNKIFQLRTILDCENILNNIKKAKKAVILGSGFIGLEIAEVFVKTFNINTTVIGREPHILSKYISSNVAEIYLKKLQELNMNFIFNSSVKSIKNKTNGLDVILDNNNIIDCDFLIESVGVYPNI